MEITWHGKTCLRVKGKNATVVANPTADSGKLKGEVVLSSLIDEEMAEIEGVAKVFDWPGEYEIKGIPITALPAYTKAKSDEEGAKPTLIFCFEVDEIKICHIANIGHELTNEMVSKIGNVDILMLNCGENSNLSLKKTIEIAESIEPRAILAMGEGSLNSFLKEVGAENTEIQEKFTIKNISELPSDKVTYIVLQRS